MRNSIRVSVRCILKTTNASSDVTYKVLVGCYTPFCYMTFKGELLDNEILMRITELNN